MFPKKGGDTAAPHGVVVNENKQRFLKVLHLVMTIVSIADESMQGKLATYKKPKRPSYVNIENMTERSRTREQNDRASQPADEERYVNLAIENYKCIYFNPNDQQKDEE